MSKDPASRERITEFMKEWVKNKRYYGDLTKEAERVCRKFLEQEGIKAEFKSRVKEYGRLEAKCINRVENEGKKYDSLDSIFADIVDLSGVRIALYFPNQYVNVGKLIGDHFIVKEVKPHVGWEQKPMPAEDVKRRSRLQSPGYVAQHYRVQFKPQALPQDHWGEGLVEIQVMSALNNFWSNIGHDITYRSLSGKPSEKEENLLKGLNGLLYTGDWLLEMFHEVHDARVKQEDAQFANHFELGAYLSKHEKFSGKIQQQDGGRKLGLVKGMYQLLEVITKEQELLEAKAKEQEKERPSADDPPTKHSSEGTEPKLNTSKGLELAIKDLSLEDESNSEFMELVQKFGNCEVTISVFLMNHLLFRFDNASDQSWTFPGCRKGLVIMWSTILWLDELFPASFALEDNLLKGTHDTDKQVVYWLCEHEEPRKGFLQLQLFNNPNDNPQRREERISRYAEHAWGLFTHAARADAVVGFAFNLSRRGVLWSFPENFTRFGKRKFFGVNMCFPDWP